MRKSRVVPPGSDNPMSIDLKNNQISRSDGDSQTIVELGGSTAQHIQLDLNI